MTRVPLTVAVPCAGAPAITIPVAAAAVMKGARSTVAGVFNWTVIEAAPATGGIGATEIVNGTARLPVPALLVAVSVALKVPTCVGVPLILPVVGSTVSPGGSPVAP